MNKKLFGILIVLISVQQSFFRAQEPTTEQLSDVLNKKLNNNAPTSANNEPLIYFNLRDEKLFDLVNRLAAQKQINIMLPSDLKKLMETTINFKVSYKITLSRAWQMLVTMLDIAGFSVIADQNVYTITPKTTINQKIAPLYIDYATDLLPTTNEVIRYVYYFHNLSLKDKGTKENLQKIVADTVVPADIDQGQQNFALDETFNILLITAPANVIKSTIPIIRELDQNGFRETIEVVQLSYSSAKEVTDVLNQLIPKEKGQDDMFRFPPVASGTGKSSHTFFSASTRIVSIDQSNSVAIFGPQDSVERVKKIIKNNLDTRVDAERTVLHLKRIRYLNAEELADTLNKLVESKEEGAQSTGTQSLSKLLSGVIIVAEKETVIEKTKKQQEQEAASSGLDVKIGVESKKDTGAGAIAGGNNLIIACTNRDWKILEKLIDTIDGEINQIALEVLIVDVDVTTSHMLTSQLRRIMNDQPRVHELKWQSAMDQQAILDYKDVPPTQDSAINPKIGLEADLLSTQPPDSDHSAVWNLAEQQPAGSTLFTFKDNNGIALVLSLLESYKDAKILSKPFLIARSNEPALVLSQDVRYVPGTINPQSKGGTPVVNYIPMVAALRVQITPRISMPPDNINLDIKIDADNFIASDIITRRTIRTNANISPKEILVLGGISQATLADSTNRVPILGSLPIIGNLFRKQSAANEKRNLIVFISPKRIPPASARAGMDRFTSKLLKQTTNAVEFADANFSTLRDPIANFLFAPEDHEKMAQTMRDYRYTWKEPPAKKKKGRGVVKKDDTLKNLLKKETNPFKK